MILKKILLIALVVIITSGVLWFLINNFLIKRPQVPEEDEEGLFRSAQELFAQGKYKETAEKYQKLINEYPNSPLIDEALFSLGFCYKNMNNINGAITAFERIITEYPDSEHAPRALYEASGLYLNSNPQKAQGYLDIIVKDYPESGKVVSLARDLNSRVSASLLFDEAQTLFGQGKYEEALPKYEQFIDTYPGAGYTGQALLSIAFCHERLKDTEQALIYFERVINEFPESAYAPDALYYASELHNLNGNNAKAKEYCQKILDDYPSTRDWLILKAQQCLES